MVILSFLSLAGFQLRGLLEPWVNRTELKLTLNRSAEDLTAYFSSASDRPWESFVHGLTPKAQIRLSILGSEVHLDGQAAIAKAIREHQGYLKGLRLRASNSVVEASAGRLATVLVQAVVENSTLSFQESAMLRFALIRVDGRWLIHQIQSVEGYMPLL